MPNRRREYQRSARINGSQPGIRRHPLQRWGQRSFVSHPALKENWDGFCQLEEERLVSARGQLHQAVQLVTASGISYLPAEDDDSHTSFSWNTTLEAIEGQPLRNLPRLSVALRPRDMTLLVAEYDRVAAYLTLDGSTLPEAAAWLQEELHRLGLARAPFSRELHFELPPYPAYETNPLSTTDNDAYSTFQLLYANTFIGLNQFLEAQGLHLPIRIWPHHFDQAVLISQTGESTIGMGLSPGDEVFPAPYLYVSPWPTPEVKPEKLPPLANPFCWNTKGWTGAMLHYRDLCDSDAPQLLIQRFLRECYQSCQEVQGK